MIGKISTRQIMFLIIISKIATILTIMPTIHMLPANQDIWIMIIASFFYSILLSTPILFLSNKFNNMTIIGYMEKIFGKVVGKIIGILYAILFIRAIILFLYIAVQMIRSTFMTGIPSVIAILILMGSCIYMASKGVEIITRSAELFGPIIITMIIVLTLLGYNNIDLTVLLPIYKDSSFIDINLGALQMTFIFTDIHILAMLVPKLEQKKDLYKIYIKSLFYSLAIILIIVVVTQTSLGIEQTRHENFPFLTYVRCVRTYSIFERIESVYLIIWVLSIMIRITAYLNISSMAIKEILNQKEDNIVLYIIGAGTAIVGYYLADINSNMGEIISLKPLEYFYYSIFKTIIPLIAILIYLFRKKSFEKQNRLE